MTFYQNALSKHYGSVWKSIPNAEQWTAGPMRNFNPDFCVLEFPPYTGRDMWTYATDGMSLGNKDSIELHIFSNKQDSSLVELLTVVAYYSFTDVQLNLGETVNFGKPWQESSLCAYGLISLPYLDGPELEEMLEYPTKCYWLIPITQQERNFKAKFGLEALEEQFDLTQIDYVNPNRPSAI